MHGETTRRRLQSGHPEPLSIRRFLSLLPAVVPRVLLCVGLAGACVCSVAAQETAPPAAPSSSDVNLLVEQQAIFKDYADFERRLAEIGESLRGSDFDRANLLIQARSESQRNKVTANLQAIVAILGEKRPYADAVERQKIVIEQLEALLRILQTDAQRDRLRAEREAIEAWLKENNRLIAAQKDVRADTDRGGDLQQLEGQEQKIAESAGGLARKIDDRDAQRRIEQEAKNGDPQPSDSSKPGDQNENPSDPGQQRPEGQSPEGKTPDGEQPPPGEQPRPGPDPKPDEPSPMQPGQQSPGQKSPSQQGQQSQEQQSQSQQGQQSQSQQGQQSQGQQSQGRQPPQQSQQPQNSPQGQQAQQEQADEQKTPGRNELEEARRKMEQAIQELKGKNRERASDEQDQAIARLEAMKAKLEEILRQLREEERELYLAQLEARFQEMLRLQLRINAETVRLDARDAAERGEAHFTKSRDLAQQEQQNVIAAQKALALLKEEGSSVAFPEAVEQMRSNMETVASRLSKGDTGDTTRLVENLIVESLEEMVLSLQKELEKIKDQKKQQQQQQGEQQDQPLVDKLAELKMVRSLQNQVNRLTQQLGLEVEGERASHPDTLQLLQDLARRQQRIQEATYDLATGRNR